MHSSQALRHATQLGNKFVNEIVDVTSDNLVCLITLLLILIIILYDIFNL